MTTGGVCAVFRCSCAVVVVVCGGLCRLPIQQPQGRCDVARMYRELYTFLIYLNSSALKLRSFCSCLSPLVPVSVYSLPYHCALQVSVMPSCVVLWFVPARVWAWVCARCYFVCSAAWAALVYRTGTVSDCSFVYDSVCYDPLLINQCLRM